MVDRLEEEQEKRENVDAEELKINLDSTIDAADSRWKKQFIKIWNLNEQLQKQSEEDEKFVGPKHFKALMKLGQGSFGVVYLVEKYKVKDDVQTEKTGKFFAMKILNKK